MIDERNEQLFSEERPLGSSLVFGRLASKTPIRMVLAYLLTISSICDVLFINANYGKASVIAV
jgi:hypothetical protein